MISIAFSFIYYTTILPTKYNLIWRVYPDSIPTLAQCWFNVVHYNGPWPAYNLGPV